MPSRSPAVSPISAPDDARPSRRRHHHGRVGDRLSPPLRVAATCRSSTTAARSRQYRGVTPMPGAYVLGQRFQHYRNSNFIDGVGRDARFVAEHICRTNAAVDRVTAGSVSAPK